MRRRRRTTLRKMASRGLARNAICGLSVCRSVGWGGGLVCCVLRRFSAVAGGGGGGIIVDVFDAGVTTRDISHPTITNIVLWCCLTPFSMSVRTRESTFFLTTGLGIVRRSASLSPPFWERGGRERAFRATFPRTARALPREPSPQCCTATGPCCQRGGGEGVWGVGEGA
jgi:hypothetical protein